MNQDIRNIEPKALWNNFADLNAVPRPSKKEEKIIAFAKAFGEKLNLPTIVDEVGNVIIKKPATKGLEDRVTIVLQSHLDMVHQKNAATNFDFLTQGIDMYVDGDWVKAKGTTLGADNGIGVAAIMAILESKDIAHPAIEALFTIDEETGMTGAIELKGGILSGKIMLNLDTEDDHELTIGCAGGVDVTAKGNYGMHKASHDKSYKLTIKGLTGGHSGMDIHRGRGNANKLMNRLLAALSHELKLEISSIDGGSLRNAIPRESVSEFYISSQDEMKLKELVNQYLSIYKSEYQCTDPNLTLLLEEVSNSSHVLPHEFQVKLINSIYACPNGIYRMSPDIEGLVQTSNNIARVIVKDGAYQIQCLTRSSVETEKQDLQQAIISTFELIGSHVTCVGSYPGWTPKPSSAIVTLMSSIYKQRFNSEAKVSACHAGLECGILGRNYPDMQMISFGPNITGAHSPDEKVQISSVQKFWGLLLETLSKIPASI
jgi:dipeptidase D